MNRFRSRKTSQNRLPLILIGAGFLFIIILYTLLLPGEPDDKEAEVSPVTTKEDKFPEFGMIDKRLIRLEEQDRIVINRIENLEISLSENMEKIRKKLESLEKKQAQFQARTRAAPSKKSVSVSKPKKKKRRKAQYHEVSLGETLYLISGRYGLSVEELRRLNNLEPGAVIHPGQKLIVRIAD